MARGAKPLGTAGAGDGVQQPADEGAAPDLGAGQPLEEGVAPDRGVERAEGVPVPADGTVQVTERHRSPGQLLRDLLPEIVIAILAVYLWSVAGGFETQGAEGQLGPAFWPRMAALGLLVAAIVRVVQTVRDRNRPVVTVVGEFDEFKDEEVELHWSRFAIALALAVGYVVATMFIGYLFATAIFLTAFIWLGGQRKWYTPVVGVVGALVFAYLFIGIVYVSLPTGVGIFDTITVTIYNLLGIQ